MIFFHRINREIPKVSDAAELRRPRFRLFIKTKIICGGFYVNNDDDNNDDDGIPSQQREKEEAAETQNDTNTINFLVPLIRPPPK